MAVKYSLFSYKNGNSFLHKCKAWQKIVFIPILSILSFYLPIYFSVAVIIFQFCLAFYLKFSLREQVEDFKPVIYYAFLLFVMKILILLSSSFDFQGNSSDFSNFSSSSVNLIFDKDLIFMLVKLFCLMQMASIVFKTSTSLELREGIEAIEIFVRKILHLKNECKLTDVIALFINFIPLVSKNWQQSVRAWKARAGKKSIKMYFVLIPVLFSVGMKQAYNASRALSARKM